VDAAQYDAVVMKPPFANNQDIAAWQFVRPGEAVHLGTAFREGQSKS